MFLHNVLIIDDDTDDQLLISDAFTSCECQCVLQFAGNGRQALDVMIKSAYRPDLILLDLNMPVMTGFEFLLQFSGNSRFCGIPVIVLTTTSDINAIIASYKLGASSFIVKPQSFPALEKIALELTNYWFKTVRLSPDA
ncbi:MAG TPA: response regulator [Dyadobacter sp.]|jgi:CheY-like chemotaxis protein|nr:response regulator [Dyadobacter sp.]